MADPSKHFDAKGKLPSEFTVALQNQQREMLPLEDKRDFEESNKSLIAAPL
jgi:alkyl sulfatase BDS1-like metallo-beta-lactamase superfamily hydrolase